MKRISLAVALLFTVVTCAAATPRDIVIDYLALYYAARAENELLVKALLERGAPVNAPDVDSAGELSFSAVNFDSPLQVAADNGDIVIVKLLLERKPRVDHRCCTRPAALGLATDAGHVEIVRLLLAAGADPTIRSEYDDPAKPETPIEVAKRKGYAEITRLLLAARPPARNP